MQCYIPKEEGYSSQMSSNYSFNDATSTDFTPIPMSVDEESDIMETKLIESLKKVFFKHYQTLVTAPYNLSDENISQIALHADTPERLEAIFKEFIREVKSFKNAKLPSEWIAPITKQISLILGDQEIKDELAKQGISPFAYGLYVTVFQIFGFDKEDTKKIIENCIPRSTIEDLVEYCMMLQKKPYTLTGKQFVSAIKIISDGVSENLKEKLKKYDISLFDCVSDFTFLRGLSFSEKEANRIIFRRRSQQKVETLFKHYDTLITAPYELTNQKILKMVIPDGGHKNVTSFIKIAPKLKENHGLGIKQSAKIVSHHYGSHNLKVLNKAWPELEKNPLKNNEKIVKLFSMINTYVKAIVPHLPTIKKLLLSNKTTIKEIRRKLNSKASIRKDFITWIEEQKNNLKLEDEKIESENESENIPMQVSSAKRQPLREISLNNYNCSFVSQFNLKRKKRELKERPKQQKKSKKTEDGK